MPTLPSREEKKRGGGSDSDSDSDEDEVMETSVPLIKDSAPKGRRNTVVAAPPKLVDGFVAPEYKKTPKEIDQILSCIEKNLLFSTLETKDLGRLESRNNHSIFTRKFHLLNMNLILI
jgi:hypothetical protein